MWVDARAGREGRGRETYGEKAVLLAVLADLLLCDRHGLRSLGHGRGCDAGAVVLRRDVLRRDGLRSNCWLKF